MKWLILAPGYTPMSGGIAALHSLCDRLNRIGEFARLAPMHAPQTALRPGWETSWVTADELVDDFDDDTIVVYPEITEGNPLAGKRVVRWLLNRPGYLGATNAYEEGDMLVAFSAAVDPSLPVLHLPTSDPEVFYPGDGPRVGVALWVGKNTAPGSVAELAAVEHEITRSWPVPQTAYADLLRSVEVLYSCDSLTAVNLEATLCGTPVLLFPDRLWSRADLSRAEVWHGIGWVADLALEGYDYLEWLQVDAQKAYPAYVDLRQGLDDDLRQFVTMCEWRW